MAPTLLITIIIAVVVLVCLPSESQLYDVELYSMSSVPVISTLNEVGFGYTPCEYTFNPSYVPLSPASNPDMTGVLLRTAKCPASFGGSGDHIMWAPCDLITGLCGDVVNDIVVPFDSEDPRVVYDANTDTYYNFYWASNSDNHGQSTVDMAVMNSSSMGSSPYNPVSWTKVAVLPWHRNGCLLLRKQLPHYIIYGESGALPGIGIAKTYDLNAGVFEVINDTWYTIDPSQDEVVVEAGSPPVLIPKTMDYFHLYAAGTTGWVPNGNYTAGYIIMDANDPTVILQRSKQHILVPEYPYQIGNGPYPVQRNRTIFAPTVVNLPNDFRNDTAVWDYFRVWFGAADATVGTAVIRIKKNA